MTQGDSMERIKKQVKKERLDVSPKRGGVG
jgi:hypothetical protein